MALSNTQVQKAKPANKNYRLYDEKGLYLEVTPAGGKLWRLKYRFDGKEKRLALGACPTVGATQYIPRLIGDRLAKEMIFLCRTFKAEEAASIGLINRVVPKADLRKETEAWCQQIKGYSGQTLRATKKSLNFESDELYASWQQGMELLAEIWGSEESLEGMNAFLEKRKPDFHQYRLRRKDAVDTYLDDLRNDRNQRPPKG